MNFTTLDQTLDALFTWTWRTSLQASVLIGLVLLIQLTFGKWLAPRWRYALGLLVLLRLALPFTPASHFSIFNLGNHFATKVAVFTPTPVPTVDEHNLAPLPADMDAPGKSELKSQPLATTSRASISPIEFARYIWLAGVLAILANVFRQHRKLTRELNHLPPLADARTLALLTECKLLLGVKRELTILIVPRIRTPALFGNRKPRLLLPEGLLETLDDRELRLIFFHELSHLKRGDILVNWAAIFFHALHWFNPAVWLALKRLRADQEMACDADVMTHLAADERRLYGNTLLKLVGNFSAARFCPSLVPFITNKNIIKRRINMIVKFKPATRLALAASVAMLLALGCFTFTRAANNEPVKVEPPPVEAVEKNQADAAKQLAETSRQLALVQQQLAAANQQLAASGLQEDAKKKLAEDLKVQEEKANQHRIVSLDTLYKEEAEARADVMYIRDQMDEHRKKLNIPNDIAEGKAVSHLDGETLRHYQVTRFDSEVQYAKEEKLLAALKQLDGKALKNALLTAAPDTILTSLEEQRLAAEAKLDSAKIAFGQSHPDYKHAVATVERLNKSIDERMNGILAGMEARVSSLKLVADNCAEKIESMKKTDIDDSIKYRQFFDLKRQLELKQKLADDLAARLQQRRLDDALSPVSR